MTDINPQQFHLEPVSAVVSHLTGVLHDLAEVEQKGCNELNFYCRRGGLGVASRQPRRDGVAGGRYLRALPRDLPATPSVVRAADRLSAGRTTHH